MITVLSLYCDFKGWQGGTIHQALKDFQSLSEEDRKEFHKILDKHKVVDDFHFKDFIQ